MSAYQRACEALATALGLTTPPVALCFADSVPAGLPQYDRCVPAGCRFWEEATRRAFATSAADHSLCAIGVYTHHLEPSPGHRTDLADALRAFAELGYVRDQDMPLIPVLQTQPRYIIYAPLSETPLAPDVILLFVTASQTLILSEAAQQLENQHSLAMGRPACAVIAQAKNSGRAALSLGCCGARAYLDVLTDNTAIFAIPGEKLEAYTERVEALARANCLLSKFHQIRRGEIEAGGRPTVKASLAAVQAAS